MTGRWAREAAPPHVEVKLTCIGPHMLAKFSNNQRRDLYPTDRDLAFAYADILNKEMRDAVHAGCEFIQFDEPAWTAFPEDAAWAVGALNRAAEGLHVKIGLHVCGGNARRKRVYFTRYDDLAAAFARTRIDQVSLEYCTLAYNMLTLWDKWKFKGEFVVGVVDQRSDDIESPEVIGQRTRPVLEYFSPEKLLLSSECGFQHVPLDITRRKLEALVAGANRLRSEVAPTG
jgi:5-methyltetrahydropteroyltriglutamate--homocysteine methyltransferase